MVAAGVARKESRGAPARPHHYPERDDKDYPRHTIVHWCDGAPTLAWKPVTITKWQSQERKY